MEIWKEIEGTAGKYEVSNTGKVRSLNYGNRGFVKELKPKVNRYGYMEVKIKKSRTIHRLVAAAFIPNPNNLPAVNHIDANKKNNCVENLEWVTNKQNSKHARENGLLDNLFTAQKETVKKQMKPIVAVNMKTGKETYYESQNKARIELGDSAHNAMRGEIVTYKGYVFYEPSGDTEVDRKRKEHAIEKGRLYGGKGSKKRKSVLAINLKTGEELVFKSAREAKTTIPNSPCVYDVLSGKIKQSKGYAFKYLEKTEGVVL